MPSILCISADSTLLMTRSAVLAITGAHVVSSEPSAAASHLSHQGFDCVVICHTVKPPQVTAVLRITSAQSRQVLLLRSSEEGNELIDLPDLPNNVILYRTDIDFGPARLLSRVRGMLENAAQSSAFAHTDGQADAPSLLGNTPCPTVA